MKKAVFLVSLVMVLVGACAAQSASNDAQRIVGTWVSKDGSTTFVFNANGTGTASEGGQTENFDYGISASGEIIMSNGGYFKIFMSPDGRRMCWAYNGNDDIEIVFQKK